MFLLLLFAIFEAVACNTITSEKATNKQNNNNTYSETPQQLPILLRTTVERSFSNNKKLDKFELTLTGTSLLQETGYFCILSNTNDNTFDTIFKQLIHPGDISSLIVSENNTTLTEEQTIDFIKKQCREFFKPSHFASKIKIGDFNPDLQKAYPTQYPNNTDWNNLQKNNSSYGFCFLLGKKENKCITYNTALKKVALYSVSN